MVVISAFATVDHTGKGLHPEQTAQIGTPLS